MKRNLVLLVGVCFFLLMFIACSHRPTSRRVCANIKTIPAFGEVTVNGRDAGEAIVSECFNVAYEEIGTRMLQGYVYWQASGKKSNFAFLMDVSSGATFTVRHPSGEGFSEALDYAEFKLKERAIQAQEEAAEAAKRQAEAEESQASTSKFNSLLNTYRTYKLFGN